MVKMTLENEYNKSKRSYAEKYGLKRNWMWEEEGKVNCILDYLSHCEDFTPADWEFIRKEGIEEEAKWALENTKESMQ